MRHEKSAGAVVYRISDEGKTLFLLLQAITGKPWGFPKGRIKVGETEIEAALREVSEETGLMTIEVDAEFRASVYYNFRQNQHKVAKEVVYFLAKSDSSQITLSHEHVNYRWVPYDEAVKLVVFDNSLHLLKKALQRLETLPIVMPGS